MEFNTYFLVYYSPDFSFVGWSAPYSSKRQTKNLVWNKQYFTYFDVYFAFANANLHDDCVIVFAHSTDPQDFYVAKDLFGMNDLNLQSLTNLFELVNFFCPQFF